MQGCRLDSRSGTNGLNEPFPMSPASLLLSSGASMAASGRSLVTSLAVSWLRPFLNEDPCGLIAAASLPYGFLLPAVACAILVVFLSTCCAWHTARPELLDSLHVLRVAHYWMLALNVSVICHRSCTGSLHGGLKDLSHGLRTIARTASSCSSSRRTACCARVVDTVFGTVA